MGKYMKKAKAAGEVAVMEVAQAHQPPLSVRTRSRTVLQKNNTTNCDSPAAVAVSAGDYLQLRSRRLEKPPAPRPKLVHREIGKSKINTAAAAVAEEQIVQSHGGGGDEECGSRNLREITPCSRTRDSDDKNTRGSATRLSSSTATNRYQFSMLRNIPSAYEMEEFFSGAEEHQQRKFLEKYNFDPVNDIPLAGRYEWVQVDS